MSGLAVVRKPLSEQSGKKMQRTSVLGVHSAEARKQENGEQKSEVQKLHGGSECAIRCFEKEQVHRRRWQPMTHHSKPERLRECFAVGLPEPPA